jgi:hemolysin III
MRGPLDRVGSEKARQVLQAAESRQTIGEEIANSVSHGAGLLGAFIAIPFLIRAALQSGTTSTVVGASVFAATVVLLYSASTLYHALPRNTAKRLFRALDYGAVFLLIAGTYTPFTLGVLRGAWGWTLFGLVWTLAVLGVVLTAVGGVRYPRLSTGLYLGMGWLIIIAIRPLWLRVPPAGLLWLLAGGLAYTAGVAFLMAKRLRFGHFVWHLFVLVGSTCHFIAVLSYAA